MIPEGRADRIDECSFIGKLPDPRFAQRQLFVRNPGPDEHRDTCQENRREGFCS